MGYDGKDSSGWIYIGEDIEKYIPAESDLEHIDRIDQSLPIEEQKAQAKAILNMLKLNAKSGLAISPKGKSAVKIVWYDEKYSLDVLDGVETFRSTKKSEGYGKKPMLSSVTGRYFNTAIEDGQKYYYKVRGYIKIDGTRYYTDWSDVISQVAKRFVIVAPNRQVIKSSNSPEKAKLKVTLQKQTGMTKYEIRYSMTDTKVESKYGTVTMTNNKKYKGTQSKTFSSSKYIKSGKYVYVKARGVYTKPNGTTGYTAWSKVMKVKIR